MDRQKYGIAFDHSTDSHDTMNQSFLSIILSISILISAGWTSSSSDLRWTSSQRLTWEDFRGPVNAGSHADAASAIRISATPYYSARKIHYHVTAYFVREESWCKTKSDALLRHEQLHFDIAELYARKVRKKVHDLQREGVRDVSRYQKAVQHLLNESNTVDASYDRRTYHGVLKDKQYTWEKNIASQLKSLERFAANEITDDANKKGIARI